MEAVPPFELYLFFYGRQWLLRGDEAGVDGFVVDWEIRGKAERQVGYDTEINTHTVGELEEVRAATARRVLCRLNPVGPWTPGEIEAAVGAGADEVLVPMVRSAAEVATVLDFAGGRCGVGILVETQEAVAAAEELAALPLSRVYVGLQDLAIARRSTNPFLSVSDGTVEKVRGFFSVPFGFAGLTVPEGGFPIPSRLLAAEMVRLRCNFTFLRRSFYRDVAGKDMGAAIGSIRQALAEASSWPQERLEAEHRELLRAIAGADVFFAEKHGRA
ncbi:MAG: aldolase/citrate lyase family protein [Thermoanaerobaculum sp.]